MAKKKNVLGLCTAMGGIGGVTAGLIKGGSIGVAAFGGAIGLPLWAALGSAGVTMGAVGAGAYYGYKKVKRKSKNRNKRKTK